MGQSEENLQQTQEDITISNDGNTENLGQAAPSGAEDATLSGYQAVIESQNKTIDALIAQNQTLQEQIKHQSSQWEKAIRQGAAFNNSQSANVASVEPNNYANSSLQEPYVPLKDMDFTITKKDLM